MTEPSRAVFLSYASQDAETAKRICEALRAAGIEVWFDQNELRGGDAWDRQIRRQIHDSALFIPIISARTQSRPEGYFRLEWKLAVERTHLMSDRVTFLVPVVIDSTRDQDADVPDAFKVAQWTRLPAGETSPAFVERVSHLLSPDGAAPLSPGAPQAHAFLAPRERAPSPAAAWRSQPVLLLIAAFVVIGAGYFTVDRFVMSKRPTAELRTSAFTGQASAPAQGAISEKSIAVLPFADMSEKKDQEYFADGMAEEILNVLAKIPGLHVIGRTSCFQFKGKNEDLRNIGIALGAAHLVEGSVRRSGDLLRVTAQLIRAADGAHEWSESYERKVDDVLKIQQEISVSVARALQVAVQAGSFSMSGSINPEAYDFYLRGLNAFGRADKAGFEEAINDFQNAMRLDPSIARADDGIALAQFNLADDLYEPQQAGFARARQAAQHLLRKDPRSFSGHVIMSRIYADYDWDWANAAREAAEAIAMNPGDDGGFFAAASVAGYLGQWDEGERNFRAALSLDPLDLDSHYMFGCLLWGQGRYSESLAEFRRAYEISPVSPWAHGMAGLVLLGMDQRDAALREAQLEPMPGPKLYALSVIYYSLGNKAESDSALEGLKRDAADRMAAQIGWVHAYRGEKDQAFEWLERAYRQKDTGLPYIKESSFLLKSLGGDPRYKMFLRKMNLAE